MMIQMKKLKIINKLKFIRFISIIIIIAGIFYYLIFDKPNYNQTIDNIMYNNTNDALINVSNLHNENKEDNINIKPENMSSEYYSYVVQAANDNDIPISVILATMTTENEFYDTCLKCDNLNGSYDMGLSQVNSKYYKYYGNFYKINNFNPYDPKQAIEFIAKHMKYLSEFGINNYDLSKDDSYIFAAGAYNRGLDNECKYRNMYYYKEKFLNNYVLFL